MQGPIIWNEILRIFKDFSSRPIFLDFLYFSSFLSVLNASEYSDSIWLDLWCGAVKDRLDSRAKMFYWEIHANINIKSKMKNFLHDRDSRWNFGWFWLLAWKFFISYKMDSLFQITSFLSCWAFTGVDGRKFCEARKPCGLHVGIKPELGNLISLISKKRSKLGPLGTLKNLISDS